MEHKEEIIVDVDKILRREMLIEVYYYIERKVCLLLKIFLLEVLKKVSVKIKVAEENWVVEILLTGILVAGIITGWRV